jgi:probable rRNA maturation factor
MLEVVFEDVTVFSLEDSSILDWYTKVSSQEYKELGDITIIFCSDDYLLEVNREHLKHDYYTDIITFDYSDFPTVSGDLFISVDRVKENASDFNVSFEHELHRVIIHGFLHLCGYFDKTNEDEILMRSKENQALSLIGFV